MHQRDKRETHLGIVPSAYALPERDRAWIDAALRQIAQEIESLCSSEKPPRLGKPSNPIYIEFLKAASIVKGYNLDAGEAWYFLCFYVRCHPENSKPRQVRYQFQRAMKSAQPRRLDTSHSKPFEGK